MLICLDTNVLIWGLKKQASPAQPEMIPRARAYLEWIETNGRRAAIPAPSLAEALIKIGIGSREGLLREITKRIQICPFDSKAAFIYGGIHDELVSKFKGKSDRRSLKTDLMILAVAISNHASKLVTHDNALIGERIRGVEIMQIPQVPSQPLLSEISPENRP